MPRLDEVKQIYNSEEYWVSYGDEWSRHWGGPWMQWYVGILPRIHKFIPAETILDIGAGQGRFAMFLKEYAEKLILVDMSEKCIGICKERFSQDTNIQYFVNDGRSLDMIPDDSIDFVFSHDALVFAEEPDMNEYINQLARKLKKTGAAFIHHSNLGQYWYYTNLPRRTIKLLRKLNFIEGDSWRAYSVSAEKVRNMCHKVGLECIVQELITWSTEKTLVDCYSLIVHRDSDLYRKPKIYRNLSFDKVKKYTGKLAKYYDPEVKLYTSRSVSYDTLSEKNNNER
jgi:ubiquinone/menaquinone biosynthesis C-methylase UbiE